MAAANGAMPGLAQRQKLKYDPIALRQPREPQYSGWETFLRSFIHPSVREVDRRDRRWGLTLWCLVLVAFGIYLFLLIKGRLNERKQPPVSVKVENKNIVQLSQPEVTIQIDSVSDDSVLGVKYIPWWLADDKVRINEQHPLNDCRDEDPVNHHATMCNLTEGFIGAPDDAPAYGAFFTVSLRPGNTSQSERMPPPSTIRCIFSLGSPRANKLVKPRQVFILRDTNTTFVEMHSELHKFIKLPKRWHPSLTKLPEKVHNHEETWSYSLTSQINDYQVPVPDHGEYTAVIHLVLPSEVITYEEQETFDVLTVFGVAAATWGSFVVLISLLLPRRPGGRRRIWPCCWRMSARLCHEETKDWDEKRRRDIQHEMDGDIEEEMKEVENQPGDINIAVLELPSLEDRVARTERVLRVLMNPGRPKKLKLRRLHQQRRQYRALRRTGRLFTTPHQQSNSSDEGSGSGSDLEGSSRGGGGVAEAKQ